jgi:Mg-chelatase subunit ChlD
MSYRKALSFLVVATTVIMMATISGAQAQKRLTERDIVNLVEIGIDDTAIVSRIEKVGLAFEPDDAAVARLKQAAASDAVLDAVQAAFKSKRPTGIEQAVTYNDVLKLLELHIDEEAILKRIEKSPTLFTLGADQENELKNAGASARLIAALKGERGRATTEDRDHPAKSDRPQAEERKPLTDLAILLDCSGSMGEQTADRQVKMAVARRVVSDLVKRLPAGLNVTFIVYGHDKELQCQAVKVMRPMSAIDDAGKSALVRTIQSLQPAGATPIALALRTAGRELAKNNGLSGVVLVSDGKETCQGNPSAEAAALAKNPKLSFGVHVVGFDVAADERKSLEAIALAGNGKYYNAASADELAKAIEEIAKELEKAAPEPTVVRRRAIRLLEPRTKMPEMARAFICGGNTPGAIATTDIKGSIQKFGEEIRVPSADEKYDLWFEPKEGIAIRLLDNAQFAERKLVEYRLDELAGLIQVDGNGTPERIMAVTAGTPGAIASSAMVQKTGKFGEQMLVPVGKYDIYIDNNLIEKGIEVEAGRLYQLQ